MVEVIFASSFLNDDICQLTHTAVSAAQVSGGALPQSPVTPLEVLWLSPGQWEVLKRPLCITDKKYFAN